MEFTKMHGLGNDYVYINAIKEHYDNWAFLAKKVSQPHFGVGSDGLILILPSKTADFKMRIFNADGSEGEMCGNGIRCVGKYVYENKLTRKTHLFIETLAGTKELFLRVENSRVVMVQVNMGTPIIEPSVCISLPDNRDIFGQPVSMGNPHFVVPVANVFDYPVERMGQLIERNPFFPNRTNVEFVEIRDRTHIKMRVWERGNGETLACGTGACAAVAAAVENGYCDMGSDVTVSLPGGELTVNYTPEKIILTGSAIKVYRGSFEY